MPPLSPTKETSRTHQRPGPAGHKVPGAGVSAGFGAGCAAECRGELGHDAGAGVGLAEALVLHQPLGAVLGRRPLRIAGKPKERFGRGESF